MNSKTQKTILGIGGIFAIILLCICCACIAFTMFGMSTPTFKATMTAQAIATAKTVANTTEVARSTNTTESTNIPLATDTSIPRSTIDPSFTPPTSTRTLTLTKTPTSTRTLKPTATLKPVLPTSTEVKEEKTFVFSVDGGKEITAYVYADSKNPGRRIIIFTPFVDKTDGNLYNASLNALWNIYGKERGLFQLDDAKTEYDDTLRGNAICWAISNPEEDFCVFPIKDSDTQGIASLRVWIK